MFKPPPEPLVSEGANAMVDLRSGGVRAIIDHKVTRSACYRIAQNGDPSKAEISFAQALFAIQTRKGELIEVRVRDLKRLQKRERLAEQEKKLAATVFEWGVLVRDLRI